MVRLFNKTSKVNVNPFFYNGIEIPEQFFCDRKSETDKIINLIENGNNIVLKAPRRLGKSSLIYHVFNQKSIIGKYNTIYVDIYSTRTPDDFVTLLYKAITECKTISDKSRLLELERRLKEISFDTEINIPKILKISKISKYEILRIEKYLDIIFDFLSKTKRPNLVVMDEFQQIQYYKDSNIESTLRSFIQKVSNTNFIFSGSSKHMLTQMFESPSKPFYRSCRSVTLDIIPKESYKRFCIEQFRTNGKDIDSDAIELVYNLFAGNTFMMQQTMNWLYQCKENGDTATLQDVMQVIEALVDEKADDFRSYLHGLKPNYELVLLCIAKEGIADKLLSNEKREEYGLPAPTTVSNIIRYFQKEENVFVEEIAPNVFKLENKLLELWAAKYIFRNLDSKFDGASQLFEKEMELKDNITLSRISKTKLLQNGSKF